MSKSERIRSWLVERALPLWATAGVDPAGGFTERLHRDGRPDLSAPKRVRVQARQIYVYSHAHLLGLYPEGAMLARRGFEYVQAVAAGPARDGSFVHIIDREGQVLDARRDTYDHAFMLFAFGWLYRAAPAEDVLRALDAAADAIEHILKHPGEGYREDDRDRPGPRRQNPHMHLFEAFLSAFAATKEQRFFDRAAAIYDLFALRLYDRDHGALVEFFTGDWKPAPGETGRIIEPGHHFEWVWLLHQFAKAAGRAPPTEAAGLYAFGRKYGIEAGSGLAVDEVWLDGRSKKTTKRCWPQTEALKAEIALAEAAGSPMPARADAIVDNLFTYYLDKGHPGGWNDVVDEANRPVSEFMPASTLYHVFLAFAEYLRVAAPAP